MRQNNKRMLLWLFLACCLVELFSLVYTHSRFLFSSCNTNNNNQPYKSKTHGFKITTVQPLQKSVSLPISGAYPHKLRRQSTPATEFLSYMRCCTRTVETRMPSSQGTVKICYSCTDMYDGNRSQDSSLPYSFSNLQE